MTAVASPPSYPNGLVRNAWTGPGSVSMSTEDMSRIFAPRRSAQRSNSSSSLSSQASTASSASAASAQSNGTTVAGDVGVTRRKPPRAPWQSSTKSEPTSGISSARSQSVNITSSVTSAASAISALHAPQGTPSHLHQGSNMSNASVRSSSAIPTDTNPPMLNLMPMNGTFERKTITAPYSPDVLRIGRQTNAKTVPTPLNGFFDSKVLSRQHAEVWAERDGKIWIRDVKSSNGTFVNGKRLSQENRDSEPNLLKENDILELGIDIISEDQKTVVHHKVAARVEHAGPIGIPPAPPDMDYDPLGQLRGRAGTNHSRFGNNVSAAAYHAKWLQPVTVEQIAKRLHKELKQARLQSQDLQSTAAFVDAVIANANPAPPPQQHISSPSRSDEVKARFSIEPPAPPPQQPLPEKPDGFRVERSSLRRTDTERPQLPSLGASPVVPDSPSVASLVEALTSARNEISSQSEKLKELEDTLVKEREARATAEERAGRLSSSSGPNTPIDDSISPSGEDNDATVRMQQRLELLQAEMAQVRDQMESFRQRAERAENENESSKKTLAEMIEAIQKRDEESLQQIRERKSRKAEAKTTGIFSRTSPKDAVPTDDAKAEGEDETTTLDDVDDEFDEEIDSVLLKHLSRQRTVGSEDRSAAQTPPSAAPDAVFSEAQLRSAVADVAQLLRSKEPTSSGVLVQRTRLEQSAPYASMLGVVLLGVGMMAYLNGWRPADK